MKIHSGGAKGSDSVFAFMGVMNNIDVIHYSFNGHNVKSKNGYIRKLSNDELFKKEPFLKHVCRHLKKNISKDEFTKKLLLRNMFQVENSDLIVAVSEILDYNNCIISGGTGYAVAGGYLLGKEIFVFDQKTEKWFYSKDFSKLKETNIPDINKFPENWAGIGSRHINDIDSNEIFKLFRNLNL